MMIVSLSVTSGDQPFFTQTPLVAGFFVIAGAALAAFTSRYVALKGLRKDVSFKLAELRLERVRDLEGAFVVFLACAVRLAFKETNQEDKDELDIYQKMIEAATRAQFLMRRSDVCSDSIEQALYRIDALVRKRRGKADFPQEDVDRMQELDRSLSESAKRLVEDRMKHIELSMTTDTVRLLGQWR